MLEMSDKELLAIAKDIAEFPLLAAQLNMTKDWEIIQADIPGKTLNQGHKLLTNWHKNGGERRELAQALDEIGCKTVARKQVEYFICWFKLLHSDCCVPSFH